MSDPRGFQPGPYQGAPPSPFVGQPTPASYPSAPPSHPSAPSSYPAAAAQPPVPVAQPTPPAWNAAPATGGSEITMSEAPAEKPSKLGEVGLILDTAALLIGCVIAALGGAFLKKVRSIAGPDWVDLDTLPAAADEQFTNFAMTIVAQILPTMLGLAGIVLGVIALRRASSRGWGLAAIAVGLAAPLVVAVLTLILFIQQI